MFCSCVLLLGGLIALSPADRDRSRTAPGADTVGLLTARDRKVRTTDPHLQRLLVSGVERSSTFRALIAALNRTDVIVYIEVSRLPTAIAGRLMLLPGTGDQRYLRIQIPVVGSTDERIATIAHELQHAIEIAASPAVRDQKGLARLYAQIGQVGGHGHSYDTVAARDTGKVVRAELIG